MTFAVGSMTIGGVCLLADRTIICADGTKTEGCKIVFRVSPYLKIGLASETDDGHAAKTLADKIIDSAFSGPVRDISDLEKIVTSHMQEWHKSFSSPPALSFMMASAFRGSVHLHFIEPPVTFVEKHCYCIGSGARVGEPILKVLIEEGCTLQPNTTLMYLVFAGRKASEQDAFVGNKMNAVFFSDRGDWAPIFESELSAAYEILKEVDDLLPMLLQTALSLWTEDDIKACAKIHSERLIYTAKRVKSKIVFSHLDRIFKPLGAQTSEGQP